MKRGETETEAMDVRKGVVAVKTREGKEVRRLKKEHKRQQNGDMSSWEREEEGKEKKRV